MTLKQILEAWRDYMISRPGITNATIKGYRARVQRILTIVGPDAPLTNATINQILSTNLHYGYKFRLAKSVSWACRWAADEGLLDPRPKICSIRIKNPTFEHVKVFLTPDEVDAIRNVPVEGTKLEVTRDMFLLQILTGWNVSDLRQCKNATIYEAAGRTWMKLPRLKTMKPAITFMTGEIAGILRKYNFDPDFPCDQIYNIHIKELGKMCGITCKLTSKIGRKTAAQNWLDRGANPTIVSKFLGNTETVLLKHYCSAGERALDAELTGMGM
jgi:hypothetical protein